VKEGGGGEGERKRERALGLLLFFVSEEQIKDNIIITRFKTDVPCTSSLGRVVGQVRGLRGGGRMG
jgi:hypothetical protein